MQNSKKHTERYKKLTEDKMYPLLWKMAIPAMIGMMVNSVYNMTDVFFVGLLRRTELVAAVGIVYSFTSLIQAIGFWFGYGSGNSAARKIGSGNVKEAENVISVAILLTIIVGAGIMCISLFFLTPLAEFLGADVSAELMDATIPYLRITLISVPVMLAANVLYNVLRLQGGARDSMLGMLTGMVLNIILDPILILGFHMGVSGAAIASLFGQIGGLIFLIVCAGRNGNVSGNLKAMAFKAVYVREILIGGAPNFARQGISSVAMVLLNQAAGRYGECGVAGTTVALRVISLVYALVIGFGQGYQPICLINYGAGKVERVKEGFYKALLTMTVFLSAAAVILFLRVENVVQLLTQDEEAIRVAIDILKAQCLIFPFMGYYILIGMFLQNTGRFGLATLVTVAEDGLFLIPATFLMPALLGYNGFVWCKSIAGIAAFLFSLVLGVQVLKGMISERSLKWKSMC